MFESINDALHDARNATPSEIDGLKQELENLTAVVHAMWIMLREHGASDNEFNATLAKVIDIRKTTQFGIDYSCPQCGNKLQNVGAFKIKCLYCGNEFVSHPFAKYDYQPADEMTEPRVEQAPVEEEYDLAKDLKFDEIG